MAEFIINNLIVIFEIIVIALFIIFTVVKFFRLSPEKQLERVKAVLLSIVTEMEKQYGPKTGQIKRSQAYSLFVTKFPIISIMISQEKFDKLLDAALGDLNKQLESNTYVSGYIGTEQTKEE